MMGESSLMLVVLLVVFIMVFGMIDRLARKSLDRISKDKNFTPN